MNFNRNISAAQQTRPCIKNLMCVMFVASVYIKGIICSSTTEAIYDKFHKDFPLCPAFSDFEAFKETMIGKITNYMNTGKIYDPSKPIGNITYGGVISSGLKCKCRICHMHVSIHESDLVKNKPFNDHNIVTCRNHHILHFMHFRCLIEHINKRTGQAECPDCKRVYPISDFLTHIWNVIKYSISHNCYCHLLDNKSIAKLLDNNVQEIIYFFNEQENKQYIIQNKELFLNIPVCKEVEESEAIQYIKYIIFISDKEDITSISVLTKKAYIDRLLSTEQLNLRIYSYVLNRNFLESLTCEELSLVLKSFLKNEEFNIDGFYNISKYILSTETRK